METIPLIEENLKTRDGIQRSIQRANKETKAADIPNEVHSRQDQLSVSSLNYSQAGSDASANASSVSDIVYIF